MLNFAVLNHFTTLSICILAISFCMFLNFNNVNDNSIYSSITCSFFFFFLYFNITFLEFNQGAALSYNSCCKICHHMTIHTSILLLMKLELFSTFVITHTAVMNILVYSSWLTHAGISHKTLPLPLL